jgi:hypothetical protein
VPAPDALSEPAFAPGAPFAPLATLAAAPAPATPRAGEMRSAVYGALLLALLLVALLTVVGVLRAMSRGRAMRERAAGRARRKGAPIPDAWTEAGRRLPMDDTAPREPGTDASERRRRGDAERADDGDDER